MAEHAVFIGEREHALDDKGRAIIPSKFRDEIDPKRDGKVFYLTIGLDQCLFLYTEKRWHEIAGQITRGSFTKKNMRQFQRKFFGSAEKVDPDKSGRILIPETLRRDAGLKDNIVMVGVLDRIEIWPADAWRDNKEKTNPLYEELSENLFGSDSEARE